MTSTSDDPKSDDLKSDAPKSDAPPKRRLGGIFANVRSTKKLADKQDKKHQWKSSLTLCCESCGAPQEVTNDMTCQYCGGHLVPQKESNPGEEPEQGDNTP